ncbi:hypothetical protein D3C79_828210 [compost metagenome]
MNEAGKTQQPHKQQSCHRTHAPGGQQKAYAAGLLRLLHHFFQALRGLCGSVGNRSFRVGILGCDDKRTAFPQQHQVAVLNGIEAHDRVFGAVEHFVDHCLRTLCPRRRCFSEQACVKGNNAAVGNFQLGRWRQVLGSILRGIDGVVNNRP